MKIKGLAILGSTGSIGRNTLQVVRMHPERFKVVTPEAIAASTDGGAAIGVAVKD